MTTIADRIDPILLKELRQGIRSQLFTGSLLLVQALLFVFGLALVTSETLRNEPSTGSILFWTLLALPLVVLVPGAASQALEKEIRGKTIELLLLTRLSAYRIVLGKWMSAVAQTTLILSSVLPYVILRYFLGGVDVWSELRALGGLLLASAVLAGIAMGFWAANLSRWAKWGLVVVLFWLSPFVLVGVAGPHGGLGVAPSMASVSWLYGLVIMLIMLELAAARIGPPAENHTTRIRLLALAALAGPLVFRAAPGAVQATSLVLALIVLVPTIIGSLNEAIRPVRRLYAPFTAPVRWRRFVLFPLCPGWPGGVAYAMLVLVVLAMMPPVGGTIDLFVWSALAGSFILPAAIRWAIFPRVVKGLGLYLVLLVLSTAPIYVWGIARTIFATKLAGSLALVAGLFPPFALFLELWDPGNFPVVPVRAELVVVVAASLLVLGRRARREWAKLVALRGPTVDGGKAIGAAPVAEVTTP